MAVAPRFREFHPATDAASLLYSSWLRPGERPVFMVLEGVDYYQVRGLLSAGDTRTPWAVVGTFLINLLLVPLMLVWWVVYSFMLLATANRPGYNAGGIFWPYPHPRVVVFGADRDCSAIRHLGVLNLNDGAGAWLLTDQRFARVGFSSGLAEAERATAVELHHGIELSLERCRHLPPEPMVCRTELELIQGQFRFEPEVARQLPMRFKKPRLQAYNRIAFSDGSGIDMRSDLSAGLSG